MVSSAMGVPYQADAIFGFCFAAGALLGSDCQTSWADSLQWFLQLDFFGKEAGCVKEAP